MGRKLVRRVQITVEDECVALICNQCGLRHDVGSHGPNENNIHLFNAGGGYGTDFPGDMDTVHFGLCSGCLKALVDGFKIPADYAEGMGVPPYRALHTEHDLEVWEVDGGWAYPKDDCPWAPYTRETAGEWQALAREREETLQDLEETNKNAWPRPTLYRHFKSKGGEDHLYEIVDRHIYDARTHEPLIVYRGLYGDSDTYIRPLAMLNEHVSRDGYDGPRFQAVHLILDDAEG